MKRLHLFLIIISVVALIGYFLLWPAVQEVIQGRENVAFWQQKLVQAQESKKKLGDLEEKYQSLQEEGGRILQAVPPSGDVPGLLVQMQALASQNGLIINTLNFVYPEADSGVRASVIETQNAEAQPAASGEATLPVGVKVLSVKLSMSGGYSNLKNFLKAVENNLRLTDVSKINFSTSEDKTGTEMGKLIVELSVYYKE